MDGKGKRTSLLKVTLILGAGEMAQLSRALPTLAGDPGQFPTPRDDSQLCLTPAPGNPMPFLTAAPHLHTCSVHNTGK